MIVSDPDLATKQLSGAIQKGPSVERGSPPAETLPRGAVLNWFCTQLSLVENTGQPDLSVSGNDGQKRDPKQIEFVVDRLIAA